MRKVLTMLLLLLMSFTLTSCAVAEGISDSIDKAMYPEYYTDHKAYVVNATHYDIEVKVIDIYQQKLIAHHFIQPKARGSKNKKNSPWVVEFNVRISTYRIMVALQGGRTNGYQSFMLYEADFDGNRSPVWIITETANKKIKAIQRFYNEK